MSMWKKWNKKSKSKDKPTSDAFKKQQEDEEDETFELPPTLTRNRERNLSISRSGRHKVRKHQRLSVMSDEMYSPEAESSPTWPQEADAAKTPATKVTSATPVAHAHSPSSSVVQSKMSSPSNTSSGGSYHCRETVDTSANQLSGSQRMARAPTAV